MGVQEQHGHGEMSPFASPQIHTTNSSLGLAAFIEQTNLVPFLSWGSLEAGAFLLYSEHFSPLSQGRKRKPDVLLHGNVALPQEFIPKKHRMYLIPMISVVLEAPAL